MPYNLHVIKTRDFIRLDAAGKPDLESSRRVLSELAKVCIDRGIHAALLDVRDAQSHMTLSDIYRLAQTFHEQGFRKDDRLAILHPYRAGERAQFFATLASDRGWTVAAFDEFEDAMEWLSTAQPVL